MTTDGTRNAEACGFQPRGFDYQIIKAPFCAKVAVALPAPTTPWPNPNKGANQEAAGRGNATVSTNRTRVYRFTRNRVSGVPLAIHYDLKTL